MTTKIKSLETFIVSIPYAHRESSSRVHRDGVTDVLIKITTNDGIVGWGESCSGANVESVHEAVNAARPMLIGRNPWNREAIAADFFGPGLWDFRPMTGSFAFAGIDMALWDICGKICRQPLYNLFGGLRRRAVNYFYYLAIDTTAGIARQCRDGLKRGYEVFYVKVGLDFDCELKMVAAIRKAIGPKRKLRIDANGAWSVNEAVRYLTEFDRYKIDFAEQPVSQDPIRNMAELKSRTPVALCANEGLWRAADVWEVIRNRTADVLCFSAYWVGTLSNFWRLSHAANLEGLRVCKHTHGELGIAAAAHHHVLLTLPNIVTGHQQTASFMTDDVLKMPVPIARGPNWGVPTGYGLGIEVDEPKVRKYQRLYEKIGQFLPYQPEDLAKEERTNHWSPEGA